MIIGKSSQEDPSGLLCFNTQNNLQDLKSSKLFSVMSLSLCPLASGDDCDIQAVPEAWLWDFSSCLCCWRGHPDPKQMRQTLGPELYRLGLFSSEAYSLEGRGLGVRWQGILGNQEGRTPSRTCFSSREGRRESKRLRKTGCGHWSGAFSSDSPQSSGPGDRSHL